ncbi:MAG: hypothetical protein ACK4HR_05515 [Hyphomonas sp.]|jgi:hypothetical protein
MPYDMPPPPETLRESALLNALFAKLSDATRTEPERDWQGHMRGVSGSARRADIHFTARLRITALAIEGHGAASDFPHHASKAERCFDIRGTREGAAVSFPITFGTPFFSDKPFHLSGQLSETGDEITGTWTFQCTENCSCGGSTGSFRLWRAEAG